MIIRHQGIADYCLCFLFKLTYSNLLIQTFLFKLFLFKLFLYRLFLNLHGSQDDHSPRSNRDRMAGRFFPAAHTFRNTFFPSPRIDEQVPAKSFGKFWQTDGERFPVGIDGEVDDILGAVVVFPGVHDADVVGIGRCFILPGLCSVDADRWKSGAGRNRLPSDYRMTPSNGDHTAEECMDFPVLLQQLSLIHI